MIDGRRVNGSQNKQLPPSNYSSSLLDETKNIFIPYLSCLVKPSRYKSFTRKSILRNTSKRSCERPLVYSLLLKSSIIDVRYYPRERSERTPAPSGSSNLRADRESRPTTSSARHGEEIKFAL